MRLQVILLGLVLLLLIVKLKASRGSERSPQLFEVFTWRQMDFAYPSAEVRQFALDSGDFVPQNINPIGVAASGSRVFITMPRWRSGVPVTLGTVNIVSKSRSPVVTPYPNWASNRLGNCDGITSVYRVKVDECNRLWVLDTGKANSQRICPAQVVAFDLATDRMVDRFRFPQNVMKEDTQPVTLEVEYAASGCGPATSATLYVADVNAFALIVVSSAGSEGERRAWRIQHRSMFPAAEHGIITIAGERMELMDGTICLALGPSNSKRTDRVLYYYPLSSARQYWVHTDVLRNESTAETAGLSEEFHTCELDRLGAAGSCGIDTDGVLYFGLLNGNALACWDSTKPHTLVAKATTLFQNSNSMQFPATVSVDAQGRVWIISTRVQRFFLGTQQPSEVNFRVFMANSSRSLVQGTPCDHFKKEPTLLYSKP